MPGAPVHTVHFADFYQRLGRPDDAARIAKTLGGIGAVSATDRTRIGAELLQLYKRHAMRTALFDELMIQAKMAAGNDERLLPLIQLGMEIKSYTFFEYILGENPGLRDRNPVLQVYEAECALLKDPLRTARLLQGLFGKHVQSYEYWHALSNISEKVLGVDLAIEAAIMSLRFADGANVAKTHAKLVHLYTFAKRRRLAIKHLDILRRLQPAPTNLYGRMATLALHNEKPRLAALLASECLAADTGDLSLRLQCCQVLIQAREPRASAAHVLDILSRVERDLRITRSQLADLLTCCQALGFELEQRVASIATRVYPDDATTRLLASKPRTFFGSSFSQASQTQ
jgi:hypothetical protein